ncbi:MAG: hypothetical protein XD58_0935, partial [Thermotoga sp. 50_1627]
ELEKVIDEVLSLTREAMVGGRHEVG